MFSGLTDVPFCVKDLRLRYIVANAAMAKLCGASDPEQLIGRRSVDFFPPDVSQRDEALDRQILATGWGLLNRFESMVDARGRQAWLLVTRIPFKDPSGRIVGVAASSRQFRPGRARAAFQRVSRIARKIEASYDEPLKLPDLAALAGISVSQLQRDFISVFGTTPNTVIAQIRINHALQLLETEKTIAAIAYECGFSDQSAFNRRFRALVGMNPRAYRSLLASAQGAKQRPQAVNGNGARAADTSGAPKSALSDAGSLEPSLQFAGAQFNS